MNLQTNKFIPLITSLKNIFKKKKVRYMNITKRSWGPLQNITYAGENHYNLKKKHIFHAFHLSPTKSLCDTWPTGAAGLQWRPTSLQWGFPQSQEKHSVQVSGHRPSCHLAPKCLSLPSGFRFYPQQAYQGLTRPIGRRREDEWNQRGGAKQDTM